MRSAPAHVYSHHAHLPISRTMAWRNERTSARRLVVLNAGLAIVVWVVTGDLERAVPLGSLALAIALLAARDRFTPGLFASDRRRDIRALAGLAIFLGLLWAGALLFAAVRGS